MKTFLKTQFANKNFLIFLGVNSFAAIANFSSRILFGDMMSYSWSIVAAYIVGMIIAYTCCRKFVFQSKKNKPVHEIIYFICVNAIGLMVALSISLILFHTILSIINDLFLREEIAHFCGLSATAFTSYLGHKYLTFK